MRNILKTISISLFVGAFLAGSAVVPFLSGVDAGATKQPVYDLHVRNATDGESFTNTSKSVTLDKGDAAQFRMRVGVLEEDIDILRFKAFFTDEVNPTKFHADIKADNLDWLGDAVEVDVPSGTYLEYIPGTTIYDVDDRPEFFTRTNVPDSNGTSQLAFNGGYRLNNIKHGEHTWIWMYFSARVVENKPTVINPRLDLTKFVANISDGEKFEDRKAETTVDPGETIGVRIVVKNGVDQSTLHNVTVSDQEPKGNATPQTLAAAANSDEASTNKIIKINITETQEINVIEGSVVLKNLFGTTIKTLSDAEVKQLFGDGLALGDIHGTFEFAKVIEYKAKTSQVKDIPPKEIVELPDTGPGVGLLVLLGSAPVGLAIRALRKKI